MMNRGARISLQKSKSSQKKPSLWIHHAFLLQFIHPRVNSKLNEGIRIVSNDDASWGKFMMNLTIRHVCNDSSNGETSHTNLVAWQGRDANHNGNNSYYKNQTSAQCPSCGTYPDDNVTGGDDIKRGEEVTNTSSGKSGTVNSATTSEASLAKTDMLENSLAEIMVSNDQLNSDNKCNDVVGEEMQLAVGMVAQGDGDSGPPHSDTVETSLVPASMAASEDVVTGALKCEPLVLLSSV